MYGGANSGFDAHAIINARRQGHLSDHFTHFPALSSTFADAHYPKDFKPANLHKYDGKQDPIQWLHLYSTDIDVLVGDTTTKVLYFPMVLELAPLTWLESLKAESVHSWEDHKKVFVDNFQGSMHCVATHHVLVMCKQEPGESLRSYVKLLRHVGYHCEHR